MSSWRERVAVVVALLVASSTPAQAQTYPGVGRAATAKEVAAWDIDVRPDFKGLPTGAGSVAKGMEVWEGKCASCHGVFGESNEFFAPIVGGTTKDDIATGRVARLNDPSFPGRTTLMKLSSVSTLWDYINRAMPWTQPKSLSTEEVYGVTAYILNMGGVLPDSFILSDQNIAEVQKLLPNRNGMTTEHALWPGAGPRQRKPDVQAAACMKGCAQNVALASFLPDFARDAHGNLAEQNRLVGAQKGADTRRPAVAAAAPAQSDAAPAPAIALTQKHACVACHGMDSKLVGPSFRDVAEKHAGSADAVTYLASKIRGGGAGVWGSIAMPAQALGETDAKRIAEWLADGAKR
jgi:S-disulfanyl-L-cysteine oxidoreductase SoxD